MLRLFEWLWCLFGWVGVVWCYLLNSVLSVLVVLLLIVL